MKKIELKTITIELADALGKPILDKEGKQVKSDFSYRDQLLMALTISPVNRMGQPIGFDLETMEARLPIREKLRNATVFVTLEDRDWETLRDCVTKQSFPVMEEAIVQYKRYIIDIKNE